jgi:hypothetical protein
MEEGEESREEEGGREGFTYGREKKRGPVPYPCRSYP